MLEIIFFKRNSGSVCTCNVIYSHLNVINWKPEGSVLIKIQTNWRADCPIHHDRERGPAKGSRDTQRDPDRPGEVPSDPAEDPDQMGKTNVWNICSYRVICQHQDIPRIIFGRGQFFTPQNPQTHLFPRCANRVWGADGRRNIQNDTISLLVTRRDTSGQTVNYWPIWSVSILVTVTWDAGYAHAEFKPMRCTGDGQEWNVFDKKRSDL